MLIVSWTYLNPCKAAQIEQRFKWKNQDLLCNHTEERDWKYQERQKICFHTCRKYHVWCRKNVSSASITKFEPPATIPPDYVIMSLKHVPIFFFWNAVEDHWKTVESNNWAAIKKKKKYMIVICLMPYKDKTSAKFCSQFQTSIYRQIYIVADLNPIPPLAEDKW